jgi:hypothetical protein
MKSNSLNLWFPALNIGEIDFARYVKGLKSEKADAGHVHEVKNAFANSKVLAV